MLLIAGPALIPRLAFLRLKIECGIDRYSGTLLGIHGIFKIKALVQRFFNEIAFMLEIYCKIFLGKMQKVLGGRVGGTGMTNSETGVTVTWGSTTFDSYIC